MTLSPKNLAIGAIVVSFLAVVAALYSLAGGRDLGASTLNALDQPINREGTAEFRIQGTGWMNVRGNGTFTLRNAGPNNYTGSATVTDYAGDAVANAQCDQAGGCARWRVGRRRTQYQGSGTLMVQGTDFQVESNGTEKAAEGSGTGTLRLWGYGTYETITPEGTTSGQWSPTGTTLTF